LKPDGFFQDAGMNSFNYYAYGAIGEWMYRVVAGFELDSTELGYKHVFVQFWPGGGLVSAEVRLETLYGDTASGWAVADGKATVSAIVPPNTHGTVRLPAATLAGVSEADAGSGGAGSQARRAGGGDDVVVEVGSGTYRFTYDGTARGPDETRRGPAGDTGLMLQGPRGRSPIGSPPSEVDAQPAPRRARPRRSGPRSLPAPP
jgi:alpha-L-rhamnosidase